MPITRNQGIAGGIAAAVIVAAGTVGLLASDDNGPTQLAAAPLTFEATLPTPADFYDNFDYGLSGLTDGINGVSPIKGDHNMACMAPTTLRDVALTGTAPIFTQLFWHCAPAGADTGHVMTAVDTLGYNIGWFSPKPTFNAISKVCWDINLTQMSARKWTQVIFVSSSDAVKYPAGQVILGPNWVARGTGGFDLGFTSPEFRFPALNGPTSGIEPGTPDTITGIKMQEGTPSWFQNGAFTTRFFGSSVAGITDKAARYTHCIENMPNNVVRLTQAHPNGTRTYDMQGQIPQDARRVVFQDDNYDPPKGSNYSATVLTWHWDNIQVYSGGGTPPPTTTTTPSTVPPASTTSVPPTTVTFPTTTTTIPTTTTTLPTTTTTTTLPTTTTTLPDPCPATFTPEERAWCQSVEARLAA